VVCTYEGSYKMSAQIMGCAVRALGEAFTPEQIAATRSLYVPIALGPEAVDAVVHRDLQYGPDPRQRLDIFAPRSTGGASPVVLFVHGGGFVQGDKGNAGDPFFNNVGAWAVRNGFIGVTMTYRLAPAHVWPAGAADVGLALEWLHKHIASHGGDAGCMVAMGHSAGAAHVAGYLAGHGGESARAAVAAAVFVSGIFSLQSYTGDYDYQVYFGSDRRLDEQRSTVAALAALGIPSLFTISQFDPPPFHRHLAAVFAARVAAQGRSPEVLWQRDHNHVSVVMQLGSEADSLGTPLAEFIRQRGTGG
jgi:acetyl esterase/lipase